MFVFFTTDYATCVDGIGGKLFVIVVELIVAIACCVVIDYLFMEN